VAEHLAASGLSCVARNFRSRRGELDLVATDGEQLVVVEVRFRRRSDYGDALESVNPAKRGRIIAATQAFLAANPRYAELPVRFDVAGVAGDGTIDWHQAAFDAGD